MAAKLEPHTNEMIAAEVKFMRKRAGYINLYCKRNLDLMKELNMQSVMEFVENYRAIWKIMLFECPTQVSHSIFSLTNQTCLIFGDTLQQMLAWDCNRPLGLRHGRLMMVKFK
jgi:hypothetical protein